MPRTLFLSSPACYEANGSPPAARQNKNKSFVFLSLSSSSSSIIHINHIKHISSITPSSSIAHEVLIAPSSTRGYLPSSYRPSWTAAQAATAWTGKRTLHSTSFNQHRAHGERDPSIPIMMQMSRIARTKVTRATKSLTHCATNRKMSNLS